VTADNFESMIPEISVALRESDFISFDCEMTGLFLDNTRHSILDDMAARYTKVCCIPVVLSLPCACCCRPCVGRSLEFGGSAVATPATKFKMNCFLGITVLRASNSQAPLNQQKTPQNKYPAVASLLTRACWSAHGGAARCIHAWPCLHSTLPAHLLNVNTENDKDEPHSQIS
jgi:hypothetical protein